MLERNYKKIIVFLICFVLFLIPQLFWGNLYQVGGDDTRLYYLFPWEFLKNFDFTIISDNALGTGGGYGSVSYFVPVTFVFFIAKILIPFINIQFFFYGINLACGFLFFYLFLGLWIREESKIVYWFRIVCSLLYIFSPYIINTLYKNQLLAIYLISVVPCTMYLFVKALQEKRWTLILLASLVYSVFSTTILTVPWFYGFLFSQIPLCIYLWFKYKKRFLVYCLLFGVSVFILNFYWLIHFILGIFLAFHSTSLYSQVSTNSSIVSNDSTIQGLSHMNSPVNQLVGYITAGWNVNSKNIFFYVSNIGFMLVILWAGIKKRQVGKSLQKVFLIFLTTLLWTFFLFTPNMGDWSVSLFLFFNHHIPLFSVVRNMYDKFALSMAFMYAAALFFSLVILQKYFQKKLLLVIASMYFVVILVVNAGSFIFPSFHDAKFSNRISGTFNNDYQNLVSYISSLRTNGSHILWLPLNQANYVAVEDANNKNHYYFGQSPLILFDKVPDYTGFLGPYSIYEFDLGWYIHDLIEQHDYQTVGKILQRLNVKYIVVNNQKLPSDANAFLYPGDMLKIQNNSFKKTILGKKIKDFGTRYSLYTIAPQYESNKIYLTNTYEKIPTKSTLSFKKLHSYEYLITLHHAKNNTKLVLLDAYTAGWQLHILGSQKNLPFQHDFIQKYANGWIIDTDYIIKNFPANMYQKNNDGSINVNLELFFFPQIIAWTAYGISGGFALLITSVLLVSLFRNRRKE